MKNQIFLTILLLGCTTHPAVAAYCPDGRYAEQLTGVSADCISWEDRCYTGQNSNYQTTVYLVRHCTACDMGNVPSNEVAIQVPGYGTVYASHGCQFYICDSSNCQNDTSWSTIRSGYQRKIARRCSNNICVETNTYRCASGYYGTSTNGTSGCNRCPLYNGYYGSSNAGTTSISGCYQPANRSFSDTSGTFVYTQNCYY